MTSQRIVWVIDDDDIFQFTVSKIFKVLQLPEKVVEFSDGEKAIECLESHVNDADTLPDIILLDINMPIMDGWQFLGEYAAIRPFLKKEIMIYMVTSSLDPKDVKQATETKDIAGYVTKPISFEKIRELVGSKENMVLSAK